MADKETGVMQSGAQGAAAGATVGGPWGAVIGGAGGILAGLVNGDRAGAVPNLQALFQTISAAGANERQLINSLPDELKPLYDQYKSQMAATGGTLATTNKDIGTTLTDKTTALYDPNGANVQATLAALKQQDYSTLPGTLTNLKAQLASTGGLARGGAGKAITQAVLAPAAQYSQQAATVQGQQLNTQQTAVQSAINKVAALDESTAQTLFGMSKDQATQILQYGRQDLQTQLSDLINQSRTESGQNLALQGVQANAAYQNDVAQNANQASITNGLINTGGNIVNALASPSTPKGSNNSTVMALADNGEANA